MKKGLNSQRFTFVFALLILAAGCKSEFEKVRVSGNTELIYKKAYEYYEGKDYVKAQALFELLIPAYRGKKELEKIYFTYAYTYYYDKKYILASYYFNNFATTFPGSSMREEADFMSAFANAELSPSFRLDQSYSEKAMDEFQLFINTYPKSERVKEANGIIDRLRLKMEQKAFAEAELYFDMRQYQASMLCFENLLKDFPDTKRGEQVRYMIAKAAFLLAENSLLTKQEERYQIVEKLAGDFLNKYTRTKYKAEVKTMLQKSKDKLKSFDNERYQNKDTRLRS